MLRRGFWCVAALPRRGFWCVAALPRRGVWCIAALLLLASPARAQSEVDLLLVLAVDASGSVNQARFELQRQGYADAFRSPRLLNAIRSGPSQSIGVLMFQWTGPGQQVIAGAGHWVAYEAAAEFNALALEILREE